LEQDLTLHLGLKTDPIEYRYSFRWLFELLAEEDVRHVQIGTFLELYLLPDDSLVALRRLAEEYGLRIASVFTAHRELGGFFRGDPHWEAVARRSFERLIEVGALLGAGSVGSSPGSVMRDEMDSKSDGIRCYIEHAKELMHFAHDLGVETFAVEPMSCLAEPPTLPDEIRAMMDELFDHHSRHEDSTASAGCCTDVSHGYADEGRDVQWSNMQLLEAALPYTTELHLKNTDAVFESTFGFAEAERARGIVDIREIRGTLLANAHRLPVRELVGYLEIGGPKTGRDYTDRELESQLRESLRYLKTEFAG
jgi:sugar phosphate isomerase/epimerase